MWWYHGTCILSMGRKRVVYHVYDSLISSSMLANIKGVSKVIYFTLHRPYCSDIALVLLWYCSAIWVLNWPQSVPNKVGKILPQNALFRSVDRKPCTLSGTPAHLGWASRTGLPFPTYHAILAVWAVRMYTPLLASEWVYPWALWITWRARDTRHYSLTEFFSI